MKPRRSGTESLGERRNSGTALLFHIRETIKTTILQVFADGPGTPGELLRRESDARVRAVKRAWGYPSSHRPVPTGD
ncbi:hypothetical protein D9M68_910420 [compost metagenome]